MATFLKKVAHSVDQMFSLHFDYLLCFGFEGWIWVLIALVPALCIPFYFDKANIGLTKDNMHT